MLYPQHYNYLNSDQTICLVTHFPLLWNYHLLLQIQNVLCQQYSHPHHLNHHLIHCY